MRGCHMHVAQDAWVPHACRTGCVGAACMSHRLRGWHMHVAQAATARTAWQANGIPSWIEQIAQPGADWEILVTVTGDGPYRRAAEPHAGVRPSLEYRGERPRSTST